MSALLERLAVDGYDTFDKRASRSSLAWWSRTRRGLSMTDLHYEWCRLAQKERRLAVMAPRESSKSETFFINRTCWLSENHPGFWTYGFCQTGDQATLMLERIVEAMLEANPRLVEGAMKRNVREVVFANGSKVTVAGAGKSVRGAHPDAIICDDVMSDENSSTNYMRRKLHNWFFGTIGGMTHPWDSRLVGGVRRRFAPTTVTVVGTPIHRSDLLSKLKENPVFKFYRYAAEFDPGDLVAPGASFAVETTDSKLVG